MNYSQSKGFLRLFAEKSNWIQFAQGRYFFSFIDSLLKQKIVRLEHFKIYDLTEHHDIFAAIVKWCKNLKIFDLPEVNFYNNLAPEDDELEAEFYR